MFIELHAPSGEPVFHNADQIIVVGLDEEERTNIFYNDKKFIVEESVASVMGLIEQAKRRSMVVVN